MVVQDFSEYLKNPSSALKGYIRFSLSKFQTKGKNTYNIRPVLDVSLLGIYLLFFIIFWSDNH